MSSIGEASRLSGLGIDTIRFYERTGVTPRPGRTSGGRRNYGDDEIRSLRLIRRCRDLGFSLPHSSRMLALSARPDQTCSDAKVLVRQNLQIVTRKIEELEALKGAIEDTLGKCSSDDRECPALVSLLKD